MIISLTGLHGIKAVIEIEKGNKKTIWFDFIKMWMFIEAKKADFGVLICPVNYAHKLHWYEHLLKEQHFTFSNTNDTRILNIGLMYLIQDLKYALKKYEEDLVASDELQEKFKKFHSELNTYEYRDVRHKSIHPY